MDIYQAERRKRLKNSQRVMNTLLRIKELIPTEVRKWGIALHRFKGNNQCVIISVIVNVKQTQTYQNGLLLLCPERQVK